MANTPKFHNPSLFKCKVITAPILPMVPPVWKSMYRNHWAVCLAHIWYFIPISKWQHKPASVLPKEWQTVGSRGERSPLLPRTHVSCSLAAQPTSLFVLLESIVLCFSVDTEEGQQAKTGMQILKLNQLRWGRRSERHMAWGTSITSRKLPNVGELRTFLGHGIVIQANFIYFWGKGYPSWCWSFILSPVQVHLNADTTDSFSPLFKSLPWFCTKSRW